MVTVNRLGWSGSRVLILGLLLAMVACTDTGASPAGAPQPGPGQPELGEGFADRISAARARGRECGSESFSATAPVVWEPRLAEAARLHNRYLSETGRLSHSGRGGSDLGERIRAAGYQPRAWAENVAFGQRTAETVIDAWLKSPGHCVNIMNPAYTEVGAAVVRGDDGQLYWTMVLAAPAS